MSTTLTDAAARGESADTLARDTRAPAVTGHRGVSPLDHLPTTAVRSDATVADVEAWQALPEPTRALAYRTLAILGIGGL